MSDADTTELQDPIARRYASRKFVLASVVALVASYLVVMRIIDAAAWADVLKWDLGLYFCANIGSGLAASVKGGPQ